MVSMMIDDKFNVVRIVAKSFDGERLKEEDPVKLTDSVIEHYKRIMGTYEKIPSA
jgi:hypothetical protein